MKETAYINSRTIAGWKTRTISTLLFLLHRHLHSIEHLAYPAYFKPSKDDDSPPKL